MNTTTSLVISVDDWLSIPTIVSLAKRRVSRGATTGTTSNGCAATVTVNMPTVMSIGGGFLSSAQDSTGNLFLTGGIARR